MVENERGLAMAFAFEPDSGSGRTATLSLGDALGETVSFEERPATYQTGTQFVPPATT